MSSSAWVFAHLSAMIAFVLVAFALLALSDLTSRSGISFAALAVWWIAAGLTISYFGGEDYALHAIAAKYHDLDMADVAKTFRFESTAVTVFAIGLIGFWIAGVLPWGAGLESKGVS